MSTVIIEDVSDSVGVAPPPATPPRPPRPPPPPPPGPSSPLFLSTHLITSDITRTMREVVIASLLATLGPMTVGGAVQLVTKHDGDEVRRKLATLDAETTRGIVDLDPEKMADPEMRALVHPLHVRVLSNALKHHQAILDAAASAAAAAAASAAPSSSSSTAAPSPAWSLIVEDDAVFNAEQLSDTLRAVIRDAPEGADIIFLGLPSKRKIDESKAAAAGAAGVSMEFDDVAELVKAQVIPACESYLISATAAARIADAYLPVRFSTNVQLSYLLRSGAIRGAYVSVPNAFVDGSKIGVFTSSLNHNNQLIWSQPYCVLAMHLQASPPDTAGFKAVWEAQNASFKAHPDTMVLEADWHMACGRARDAERVYAAAVEQYDANRCIVGSTSSFMKRYMAVYAHLQ